MQNSNRAYLRGLLLTFYLGLVGTGGFITYQLFFNYSLLTNTYDILVDVVDYDEVFSQKNSSDDARLWRLRQSRSSRPIKPSVPNPNLHAPKIPTQYGNEYLNIEKHKYLVNSSYVPSSCYHKVTEYNESILAILNSSPKNFDQRQQVRTTWANPNYTDLFNLHAIFLIARPENVEMHNRIVDEAKKNQDIIMADYKEEYKTLLHKILLGYRYFMDNCQKFTYLLKTDDDCYINVFKIREQVSKWRSEKLIADDKFDPKSASTLFCQVRGAGQPVRSSNSQYYVSKEEFDRNFSKKWCPGNFYLATFDMIPIMYWATLNTTYNLHLDDVLMTGVVLENMSNVHYVQWSKYSAYSYIGPNNPRTKDLMYIHGLNNPQKKTLFDAIVKSKIQKLKKIN